MAEGIFASAPFLSALLVVFSFLYPVLSRTTPRPLETTTLDVSTSLKNTLAILSVDRRSLDRPATESSSSHATTVSLHSRDLLKGSATHEDYRALTLARLARDSARVESLTTKLNVAVKGIKKSDLTPLQTEDLEGSIVSGTSQGSGEYFSRVGIGKPPKSMYMVLDTGSDVTWVQCQPCSDCYSQTDPVFDPAASSSYSPLSCGSTQCKSLDVTACRNDSCLYQVSYGDGSYTVGDFVTETITFGDSGPGVNNIAIGCGHDNQGLFVGAAGLLGLGGGSLSFPSQIKVSGFSYCLVDRDSMSASTLQLGSGAPAGSVTAPLLRNRKFETFYYLGMTGISVGGRLLSIPSSSFSMDESGDGGIIMDCGTAVTRLQSEVYNVLRDAFVSGTQKLPSTSGVALFDTCYDLSSMSSVEVPTVSLHFPEEKKLQLPVKNYLIPVDSSGTFCFAFAPTSSALSIIGNVQQQGTRVAFDLAKSVVAFEPNKC
ncbi:protein ASPARTIC PROTEASE IN GUARD CELL 1-like [Aristolochia californica]|uniref:protein ASPARTIC PROTEASE IN GUARD CELL 1-like n=1 Tax=Aristolochia californica TaxID=171875 RepID=UPI0035E04DAE